MTKTKPDSTGLTAQDLQDVITARTDIAEAVALIHLEDEDTRKSIAEEIRRHIEEVRQ